MKFAHETGSATTGNDVAGEANKTLPAATGTAPGTMEREDWNLRYAAEEFIWTADANRFLKEETAGLLPGTALDLACGEGRNAVWLAEQGWIVTAVDFSDVALEKAGRLAGARKVADRIAFLEADLRILEPAPRCFDLVALVYLQIPQAELAPVLLRAAKAVAPGGTLLVIAHDSSNLEYGYGGPRNPAVLYTAAQVVRAMGNELNIEKAGRVSRPVQTANGISVAFDCLVRARRTS